MPANADDVNLAGSRRLAASFGKARRKAIQTHETEFLFTYDVRFIRLMAEKIPKLSQFRDDPLFYLGTRVHSFYCVTLDWNIGSQIN
jgi:hypothetical protein